RLFGKTSNSFERLELAREKAHELQIFIVLKDHHTAVITPAKDVFYNVTGNSGMAKGGSGDVLTGIITALISQKYDIEKACIFGVWIHGKAGDFASETFSKEAMLPTDLIGKIGDVFKYLSS
ncbi:MAG: NAD(P)H-hydrate dehydratase, partial [Chryseobacterium sp.]